MLHFNYIMLKVLKTSDRLNRNFLFKLLYMEQLFNQTQYHFVMYILYIGFNSLKFSL